MDPLSALSIAASVVQFLDFGAKLVGTGLETYRTVEGATKDNLETEYLVGYAKDLSAGLASAQKLNRSKSLSHDEEKLLELARRSHVLADELVSLLVSLRSHGNHGSWAAVQQAVRVKWSESKIASLRTRLDAVKTEMSLQLLCMMSNGQSAISAAVHRIDTRCRNLELQGLDALAQIQGTADQTMKALGLVLDKVDQQCNNKPGPSTQPEVGMAGVVRMLNDMSRQSPTEISSSKKALLQELVKAGFDAAAIPVTQHDGYAAIISAVAPACAKAIVHYVDAIDSYVSKLNPLTRQLSILETLRFEDMLQRETAIKEAFSTTYDWIFDTQASPLAQWLEHSCGIFWVSGKPGSGKSTLLKFITQQNETELMLQNWAAGRSLVVSKHFFWGTGTALQKSFRGLLQTLVFQILRARPDLVQQACPARWAKFNNDLTRLPPEPWTDSELKQTLQRALEGQEDALAFCIFIDGLDEFAEDHFELITEIIEFHALKANVKFCVSSRPYNVFSKAFGKDSTRTFALQDMNAGDIDIFVQGKLERDSRFRDLALHDSQAADLALDIRRRADGVFLWVHLVVWDLMKGLSEEDDIATLQARLNMLPKTLEEFFAHMLNSVDQIYHKYTARSLLLAHRAREPLPIMAYAFLYEDDRSDSFLANITVAPMTRQEINDKRFDIEKKLSSWCKGLMEVRSYSTENTWEPLRKYRVDFLHRSVKDYLETSDMQMFLRDKAGPGFEPERMLARLFVAQAKVVDVQKGLSHEMVAFKFMADEAKYYGQMHDNAARNHIGAFSQQVQSELETIEHQMERQKTPQEIPDNLMLPPHSQKRRRSSREGRRSPLSGIFSSILGKSS